MVLKSCPKRQRHLVREIHHHRQFKHPHIARLYEIIITETLVWMVLEYCPGDELFSYLVKKGRLSDDETRKIFSQLCGAVAYTHGKNCAHRDLKLENILLDKKRNVKLVDFGFTREYESRSLLDTICGTTCYMAPEMVQGKQYYGEAVDVWSLGVILYTLLYGEMPFEEENDADTKEKVINDEPRYPDSCLVPENGLVLVKKLLNKDYRQRPSLNEIINDSYLEEYGSVQRTILNTKEPKLFSTKAEKRVLRHLRSAHIDLERLSDSVISQRCDSLSSFWAFLIEREQKLESKKHRTSLSIARYSLSRKSSDKRASAEKNVQGSSSTSSLPQQPQQSQLERLSSYSNVSKLASPGNNSPHSPRSPLSNKAWMKKPMDQHDLKSGQEPDTKLDECISSKSEATSVVPLENHKIRGFDESNSGINNPTEPQLPTTPLKKQDYADSKSLDPLSSSTPVKDSLVDEPFPQITSIKSMTPSSMSGSTISEFKKDIQSVKNFMMKFILPGKNKRKNRAPKQVSNNSFEISPVVFKNESNQQIDNNVPSFSITHSRDQSIDTSSMVEFKRQRPVSQVSAFSQISQISAASSSISTGSQELSGQNLSFQLRRPHYGRRSTSSSISSVSKNAQNKTHSKASSNSSISLITPPQTSRTQSPDMSSNFYDKAFRPRRSKGRFNESAVFVGHHAHRIRQVRGKSPFSIAMRDRMAKKKRKQSNESTFEKPKIHDVYEDDEEEEETEDDRGRSM